jgi:hypothetical protein
MQVTIELPENVAKLVAGSPETFSRTVLEAVLLTAVRDARLSRADARRILGVSRYEMDGLLKRFGAASDLTIDDLERDTANALAYSAE